MEEAGGLTFVSPDLGPCPMLGALGTFSFFFFKIFLMWTIFKVFIEFVTILVLFYVLVFWPRGMWNLSSRTRDQTRTPCIGRQSLNQWTIREVSRHIFFFKPQNNLMNQNCLLQFMKGQHGVVVRSRDPLEPDYPGSD